jgi:hypothetical protein
VPEFEDYKAVEDYQNSNSDAMHDTERFDFNETLGIIDC